MLENKVDSREEMREQRIYTGDYECIEEAG